jgi:kumamolisin
VIVGNGTMARRASRRATFQEAATFGMTVFVASGDYGSSAGIPGPVAHVAFPESDPWVTSVGGTTIGNVVGSSFTEVTWVAAGPEFGTTGGGISDAFDLPFWQHHHNVPLSVNPGHRKGRGVPDVAGYASGYSIVYALARRLAVIMHRIWVDGTEFRWTREFAVA